MLGEFGMTAGSGIDGGAGDAERRIEGDEPNDERRLCDVGGGFMGRASDCGVPGADGMGEGPTADSLARNDALPPKSGGAGLFEEMRRAGRSIFDTLLCWASENWPSFVFRVYMCTDRSEDCVAMYSFRGSHATPCT